MVMPLLEDSAKLTYLADGSYILAMATKRDLITMEQYFFTTGLEMLRDGQR